MKPLPPSWHHHVELARREPVPPIHLDALLRAVRGVVPAALGWRLEFAAVFARRSVLSGCAAVAIGLLSVAGWQAWEFWQDVLPWAQLIATEVAMAGGAS